MVEEPETEPAVNPPSESDGKLLKQIREDYRFFNDYWRENLEEAQHDMDFAAGNFWDAKDLEERSGRPCLNPDELSQYVKQFNNNLRQNKRAIQVNPKGMGATDKDAERRASIIRGIEYASNAQAAYTTSFEQAAWCGFGYFKITTQLTGKGNEVQPRIKRIANQFTVLLDPDAKEADFSDQKKCFLIDIMRKSDFGRRFPKAQKRSFSTDDANLAPDWFRADQIVVAEYWLGDENTPGRDMKVTQYITNGIEILEKNQWDGSWIPIIPVLGEELFTNDKTGSKRRYLSLIRRARTPQKMLAYIASQEQEEFGMSPRSPFLVFKGQVDPEQWNTLNKVPTAYVEHSVPEGWNDQWGPPPVPSRPQFIPNAQAYEVARESWRRAIQASMGLTPLPTSAQRQNEKSGVALERIQQQQAIGAFHVTDNFDRALENSGRQLNELITVTMDTPRHVGARMPDDSHELLAVTSEQHIEKLIAMLPEEQKDDYLVTDRGEFDVTISTGPSNQSQRDEQSQFADTLVEQLSKMPIPPPVAQMILAKAIQLKDVGPLTDEIVKLLEPPNQDDIPPQAQAAVAQLKGQLQAVMQKAQELQQEKDAKVIENQFKAQISKHHDDIQLLITQSNNETKRVIAEYTTNAQDVMERRKLDADLDAKQHVSAHEAAMQQVQQGHEQAMGREAAMNDAASQASDQQHESGMQAGDQAHEAGMAMGQQAHESDMAEQQAETQGDSNE